MQSVEPQVLQSQAVELTLRQTTLSHRKALTLRNNGFHVASSPAPTGTVITRTQAPQQPPQQPMPSGTISRGGHKFGASDAAIVVSKQPETDAQRKGLDPAWTVVGSDMAWRRHDKRFRDADKRLCPRPVDCCTRARIDKSSMDMVADAGSAGYDLFWRVLKTRRRRCKCNAHISQSDARRAR